MNWCFVYQNYVTGGLETFVLRMANYLVNNGNSVYLACQTVSYEMKSQYTDSGTRIEYFDIWNRKKISQRMKGKVDIFISFGLSDYFLLGKYAKYAVSLMYCVHPSHATLDNRNKTFIEMLKCPIFYYIIKKGIENDTFLMMDENISDAIYKKYKLKVKSSEVLLLPYEPASKEKLWNETFDKPYSVLTICRADFPFKSYVLGLVDAIASINKNNIVAKLTIVSYGKDLDIIKGKIKGKNYIKLIQETKYNDLETLYLDSDIYVGMGSTAIEAAKYGLPVILANVNSPLFLSCGFFCDNPQALGEFESTGFKGEELLRNVMNMSKNDFIQLSTRCKRVFEQDYDMESFVNNLTERWKKFNASN